ncbi:MAG: cyclic pyranopterin monophosphate synthase MoaC [Deltaproteobacteria bacterium]|nr:cyclic pyranopterin monophosphate synthase MoaC [Candidatus Anaeroferrophillus wilburensis]MBN2888733.1 cyclic pyranopterin monophosphate synthase MoaC [Deltaproteobacteria bacterium]
MGGVLTHLDEHGNARMVDVGSKGETSRLARAWGAVRMTAETIDQLVAGENVKGDVLAAARIAGIMAAKQTGNLIPLCHPLPITHVAVELLPEKSRREVVIIAEARVTGKTGVEMEALTAVSLAALTIYDMCKAVDKNMVIGPIALLEKRGGRSGHYINPDYAVAVAAPLTVVAGEILRLHSRAPEGGYLLEPMNGAGRVAFDRLPSGLVVTDGRPAAVFKADRMFLLGDAVLQSLAPEKSSPGEYLLSVVHGGRVDAGEIFAVL